MRFQSTLPVWGATRGIGSSVARLRFQSTLPVWGATRAFCRLIPQLTISIHAPRVGSDEIAARITATPGISIHAPRVGSDEKSTKPCTRVSYFNPRSPCGERPSSRLCKGLSHQFQSTLPVWGATRHPCQNPPLPAHFNPRSPCGERRRTASRVPPYRGDFNPRSPCGERQQKYLKIFLKSIWLIHIVQKSKWLILFNSCFF